VNSSESYPESNPKKTNLDADSSNFDDDPLDYFESSHELKEAFRKIKGKGAVNIKRKDNKKQLKNLKRITQSQQNVQLKEQRQQQRKASH